LFALAELKVQLSRADPPGPTVTLFLAQVTVRPAGLTELVSATMPKKPGREATAAGAGITYWIWIV
jgi:hypothetical protein